MCRTMCVFEKGEADVLEHNKNMWSLLAEWTANSDPCGVDLVMRGFRDKNS